MSSSEHKYISFVPHSRETEQVPEWFSVKFRSKSSMHHYHFVDLSKISHWNPGANQCASEAHHICQLRITIPKAEIFILCFQYRSMFCGYHVFLRSLQRGWDAPVLQVSNCGRLSRLLIGLYIIHEVFDALTAKEETNLLNISKSIFFIISSVVLSPFLFVLSYFNQRSGYSAFTTTSKAFLPLK